MRGEEIWKFETVNFIVRYSAEPDLDLDLSWDESGETREGLESGLYCAFVAHIEIIYKPTGLTIGESYLGGCIYENPSDLMDHMLCGVQNRAYAQRGETARCGSYFPQLIADAIAEARDYRAKLAPLAKLRAA